MSRLCCKYCGQELQPNYPLCPNCGMPVDMPTLDDETDDFATDVEITDIDPDSAEKIPITTPPRHQKETPSVRGWLLLFVILIIVGAVRNIITFLQEVFASSADMSLFAVNAAILFFAAFAIYTAVSLIRHNTNAIFLARTYIIIDIVSAAVLLLFVLFGFGSADETSALSFFGYSTVIVINILWLVFFKQSRQVKKDYLDGGAKTRDWLFIFLAGIIIIALVFYGVNEQVAHDAYNADPYAAFE
ncbi:MAG: zinc ribbon domain-containing protein [Muribaculaceae bacterium]|nr:zinc ribbon domain-containing protein [Muribaculaceae bacterium]